MCCISQRNGRCHQRVCSCRSPSFEARYLTDLPVHSQQPLLLLKDGTHGSSLEFTWVSSAPSYHGDLYEYIWQRQLRHPLSDRAAFSVSGMDSSGARKVCIRIDLAEEPAHGKRSTEILQAFSQNLMSVLPLSGSTQFSSGSQASYLWPLLSILMIITDSTNEYVNSIIQNISNLVRAYQPHYFGPAHRQTVLPGEEPSIGQQTPLSLPFGR